MALSDEPNGALAPVEQVDAAVRTLTLLRRIELVLVLVAAVAGILAAGFAAYSAQQVRSCTVPSGRCYQENTVRARQTTKGFLEDLNRQHQNLERRFKILECVLLIEPEVRVNATIAECEEKNR